MAALHLSAENFKQEVLEAKGKVLVDFFATWCGPCRMMSPIVDQLADELADVKVCKVMLRCARLILTRLRRWQPNTAWKLCLLLLFLKTEKQLKA